MKSLILLTLSLISMGVHASSGIVAHVLEYGMYDNGNVYVKLDNVIDQNGCNAQYLELPANAAVVKQVLAAAAIAAATGAAVRVMTDTCYGGLPSFAGARGSYFVISR